MAKRQQLDDGGTLIGVAAVGGLGLFAYIKWISPWLEKMKLSGQLTVDQSSTVKPAKGQKTLYDLNGKPVTSANISTIAADLEDALSYPVDEARAVRVFKSTPFGYVPKLEEFYLQRYGENLKQRMISRLPDKDWINVKFWFR